MATSVGVLGTGAVGWTLANGLKGLGYDVTIGSRKAGILENWDGETGKFDEVAEQADMIVLAIKGSAAEAVVKAIAPSLKGKIVIDTTNPIADVPPEDGVLKFFTSLEDSLMERLQKLAPKSKFVKAFNSTGAANMVKPNYGEGKPTMFICGNDKSAKDEVADILEKFGWETEDLGKATAARAIEPLYILWCIPGMLHNQWTHAFKMLTR